MPGRRVKVGLLAAVCAAALAGVGWLTWKVFRPEIDPMFAGGVRLVYRADPGTSEWAAEVVRRRVRPFVRRVTVRAKGDELEVLIPASREPPPMDVLKHVIARSGRLEFKIVDDGSEYMRIIAAGVSAPGVVVNAESWDDANSARHEDVYLAGDTDDRLAAAVDAITRAKPVPDGHAILFERRASDWRTYYVFSRTHLDNTDVLEVDLRMTPENGVPQVSLELDRDGTEKAARLTEHSIGKKMAVVFEGRVVTAPVIIGKIPNGRVLITLSDSDLPRLLEDTRDLVAVLRVAALPAPITLLREETVPPRN